MRGQSRRNRKRGTRRLICASTSKTVASVPTPGDSLFYCPIREEKEAREREREEWEGERKWREEREREREKDGKKPGWKDRQERVQSDVRSSAETQLRRR